MTEIIKYIYLMIIFVFLFLVVIESLSKHFSFPHDSQILIMVLNTIFDHFMWHYFSFSFSSQQFRNAMITKIVQICVTIQEIERAFGIIVPAFNSKYNILMIICNLLILFLFFIYFTFQFLWQVQKNITGFM
jgi:hypothetical protein